MIQVIYFIFQLLLRQPKNARDCFHPGVGSMAPTMLPADKEIGAGRIIKTMLSYVWPRDQPGLRARVVVALSLLLGAKVCISVNMWNSLQLVSF